MPSIEPDSSQPRIVLGTMTFGKQMDPATAERAVSMYLEAGGELDIVYVYDTGATERFGSTELFAARHETRHLDLCELDVLATVVGKRNISNCRKKRWTRMRL